MSDSNNRSYVVTSGDPAGSSPWLLLELLNARRSGESFVVVGPSSLRGFLVEKTGARLPSGVEWYQAGEIDSERIVSGKPGADSGEVAHRSLMEALNLRQDRFDGLLTLPLSKSAVQSAGYSDFVGHTERLEEYFDVRAVMAFFGSTLNVVLLTRHLPLESVPGNLTEETVVSTVRTVNEHFLDRHDRKPSFALLGLNPHAGEDGRLGREEETVLRPAVDTLKEEGINVTGPVPADGFLPVKGSSVDVILACYHDQGLVPFKQKHFFDGVHATLGLPVTRVSPDHGIAADRAPSGEVNSRSTLNCLRWLRGEPPRDD